jgi:hypothetical protein
MLAALKQRYGQPHFDPAAAISNHGRRQDHQHTHAEWRGKNIVITFNERLVRMDTGLVEYSTAKTANQ